MKRFYYGLLSLILAAFAVSCQKNYTLGNLANPPIPTATSTPYACPPTPTPGPPPAGIYWFLAQVEGVSADSGATQVHGLYASVLLSVNGAAESSDTVTLSGPGGLGAVLPYTGTSVQNGNTYAQYQALLPNSYQPGGNYSLKTITSIGTASAALAGPGNISIDPNGASASWTLPGQLNTLVVAGNSFSIGSAIGGVPPYPAGVVFETAVCSTESLPLNIPSSDYSLSGVYTVTVECRTMTTAITGGTGNYLVFQNAMKLLNKITAPTPTPQACNAGGPTCTPTPVGTPSISTVALLPEPYLPGSGTANVYATFPYQSGKFVLALFDASGPLNKLLLINYLSMSVSNVIVGSWDGSDDLLAPAPDGVYVTSLMEPNDWQLQLVLLIR